ncbi:MAG: toxin-antitoxin system HicB family antitoxin [Pirellulaceae bacterium]|nr:toxin-antitoxin system HicB family antitoxin [Pirellulaceae bacterium]
MITCENQANIKQAAEKLFSMEPDWGTFYREILGLHGVVRRNFRSREEIEAFERSETYREILQMLAKLRRREPAVLDDSEPTKVITVRVPKSLHETLRIEAFEHHTSMNKLCISKLLQIIDAESVPAEA